MRASRCRLRPTRCGQRRFYIGRKALRDTEFAAKFDSVSGPIVCDSYGECSQLKLNPPSMSFEAQPNVVFEVLSFGVPVIAFARGCVAYDLPDAPPRGP